MFDFIDIYCERLGPGLLAEPVNALTNLSFFIAAYCAFNLARKRNALDARSGTLIVLLCGVGAASALFHTTAMFGAMLADSLSILFYQLAYIFLYARRVMRLGAAQVFMMLALFFLMTYGAERLPAEWLNGSLSYLPAILFLAGLGLWHARHAAKKSKALLLASLVFIASLALRSVDMAVCPVFVLGTHFLWHALNGLVLYLTLRAYILNAPQHLP